MSSKKTNSKGSVKTSTLISGEPEKRPAFSLSKEEKGTKTVPKTKPKTVSKPKTTSKPKTVSKPKTASKPKTLSRSVKKGDNMKNDTEKNDKKIGLKDLDKITNDPEQYARDITIERLVTILQKMSDFYYNEDRSLVEDDVYDIMVDVLRERDPKNAYLFQTGVTKTTDKDVELPFPMPSLNKIKPGEKTLARWFKTYKGDYMLMDKLDGISMQLYKDKSGNVDIYTKKQTGMGTSKKHLLKYLVEDKILKALPNDTSVRGELVISQEDFEKIKEYDPSLKNPRSAMAGLVNTDKIDTRIAEKAKLVTYGILHPRFTIQEQLEKLKKWGFNVVWNSIMDIDDLIDSANDDEVDNNTDNDTDTDDSIGNIVKIENTLKHILGERKEVSDYLIDGIVITDNSKIYPHENEDPKYSMAFKMNSTSNMKDVEVEEVIWDPTMYYFLKPVIRIKPTVVSGNVTVTYVTAHNAKYVFDNKIGKGSIIKIVRSGDVIPYIVSVVKQAKEADMPKLNYKWNETEVDIIVTKPDEETKRKIYIKQIYHFFRTIGVKFLSDGTIAKLYDNGYTDIFKIVKAASNKDTNPYDINGLGEKGMTKIYNQIDKALTNVKLPELMSASLKFGRGLGTRKIREITKKHPNIMDMCDDDENDIELEILTIPGFSYILAHKFAQNLREFGDFVDSIRQVSKYKLDFTPAKTKQNTIKNNVMANQVVVMTGFRSQPIQEFIENNGGKISSGVSKNTTIVIHAGGKLSAKLTKAMDMGITLMTRDEFEKKYKI